MLRKCSLRYVIQFCIVKDYVLSCLKLTSLYNSIITPRRQTLRNSPPYAKTLIQHKFVCFFYPMYVTVYLSQRRLVSFSRRFVGLFMWVQKTPCFILTKIKRTNKQKTATVQLKEDRLLV